MEQATSFRYSKQRLLVGGRVQLSIGWLKRRSIYSSAIFTSFPEGEAANPQHGSRGPRAVTPKHAVAQQIVRQAKEVIADKLAHATDSEERDAIESLQRELNFREETSILRRVRRLVLDAPILDDEIQRAVLGRDVVAAYDLRGRIAHTGVATDEEIAKALARAITRASCF